MHLQLALHVKPSLLYKSPLSVLTNTGSLSELLGTKVSAPFLSSSSLPLENGTRVDVPCELELKLTVN